MTGPNDYILSWDELPGPHDEDLTEPRLGEIDEDIYKDR